MDRFRLPGHFPARRVQQDGHGRDCAERPQARPAHLHDVLGAHLSRGACHCKRRPFQPWHLGGFGADVAPPDRQRVRGFRAERDGGHGHQGVLRRRLRALWPHERHCDRPLLGRGLPRARHAEAGAGLRHHPRGRFLLEPHEDQPCLSSRPAGGAHALRGEHRAQGDHASPGRAEGEDPGVPARDPQGLKQALGLEGQRPAGAKLRSGCRRALPEATGLIP
mmetsp:Transcript_102338/g.285119  ORF Transcript_102338/g.285119 Transcript_102338/m.285119 type:complete len:221 (-) Transcript_102338:56-718(-)